MKILALADIEEKILYEETKRTKIGEGYIPMVPTGESEVNY